MGVPFERRPIERTELIIADEIGFIGTLTEVTRIVSLDGQPKGPSPIVDALAHRYYEAASGVNPHPSIDLTMIVVPDQPVPSV